MTSPVSEQSQSKHALSVTRAENYSEWYQEVVSKADMAENSPVRGCMIIKPWGYAIWENIQTVFNRMIKETGHRNAYFPLFIPFSFFEREAKHVEGFAKECAVVTHHRLAPNEEGNLVPVAALEEPLIVRPTSEMIIGEAFKGWIQSYRDLPILINQWANVVRWEMRTRLFLRTSEFLWQEGHTAHANEIEAMAETDLALKMYESLIRDYLAMPVILGEKTEGERFPGADRTFCIEVMMQDGKAIQACTSHFLGQNFAKACDIKFLSAEGKMEYAWTTSWGATTRLIGGLIMCHSDDDGLVLPPKIAPAHVVIIPILRKDGDSQALLDYCHTLKKKIKALSFEGIHIEVELDLKDENSANKVWDWVRKGIPIRLEIGGREQTNQQVCLARRDLPPKQKQTLGVDEFCDILPGLLTEIQNNLYQRALDFQQSHTKNIETWDDFKAFFTKKQDKYRIQGGFAIAHWGGDTQDEEKLKEQLTGVTIRCIPIESSAQPIPTEAKCVFTGKPSRGQVIFARAY